MSQFPDYLWRYSILPYADVEELDGLRLVCQTFKGHVSDIRAQPAHANLLRDRLHIYTALRIRRQHGGCEGFRIESAFEHAKKAMNRMGGSLAQQGARCLVVGGSVLFREWPLAPRALAVGLRTLAPQVYGALWHGDKLRSESGRRAVGVVREAGTRRHAHGQTAAEIRPLVEHAYRQVAQLGPDEAVVLCAEVQKIATNVPQAGAASFAALVGNMNPPPGDLRNRCEALGIVDPGFLQFECVCLVRSEIETAIRDVIGSGAIRYNGRVVSTAEAARIVQSEGALFGGAEGPERVPAGAAEGPTSPSSAESSAGGAGAAGSENLPGSSADRN